MQPFKWKGGHDVRLFLIEQIAVVAIEIQRVVALRIEFRRMQIIHITSSDDLSEFGRFAANGRSLAVFTSTPAHADRGNRRFAIAILPDGGADRPEVGCAIESTHMQGGPTIGTRDRRLDVGRC